MSFIPECDKCGSVEHNGLQQICDNTENQEVLNVCDKCYKKTTEGTMSHSDTCPIQVGCPECIAESKIECIIAIRRSMEANTKCYNNEVDRGTMNAEKYKKYINRQHEQRIEILVLEGKHPEPIKKKPRFRNGLWI
jgi:hypothetical protein